MILVGLTGNYGMGKSTVLRIFGSLGAVVISADAIVGRLLEEQRVVGRIREIFGDDVIGGDGRPDKKSIAARVFSDPEKRKRLEALLHPMVFAGIDSAVGSPDCEDRVVVVEVPLLFESSAACRFRKTITVHTSEEEAVRRLGQKGISREEAVARLKTQMPVSEKMKRSDYVIDNSCSAEETERRVAEIYRELVSLSRTS